ncbi:RHS repeat domain-containing protein [Xenorhabdus szentirmaii]|uniref:RHS repeat domain-containing protein n=1 Tax=Xenorhabdus szentirmaii TaxID=290112 RepID=UPI000C065578|nr:RHS repeat domain-containing protein [Xenorhabdus szentirmaii]PHM44408.1 type IV secretion protein Rhs [Xenorhabdus szentirmaii]
MTVRIEITGYNAKAFCENFTIHTQERAEKALKYSDNIFPASEVGGPNASWTPEEFKRVVQDAVDKFKSGEFPLEEWKHTPPEPNEPLPDKPRDDSPTGTGNTLGKIVGQAPQGANPPHEANAAVIPETEQEKGFLDKAGDWWDETKKDVTKWGEEAGEKLNAAWDNPGKAAIGATKGVWNIVPDVGEFVFRGVAGIPATMMSASGTVLKYVGADTIGDTALAAAGKLNQAVDKAVELSNVDAIRFDITDKAEQGGALIADGAGWLTGIVGALKQGAKVVVKKAKPSSGGKIKAQPKDTPEVKPKKEQPKDDATPSNNKDGNCNGTCTKKSEPVDVATGDFLQEWPVIAIPGLLPITLNRSYRSTAKYSGLFGSKWADDWSRQLVIGNHEVLFTDVDGVVYDFATPDNQVQSRNKHIPHYVLTGELNGELGLTDRQSQLIYHFNQTTETSRKLSAITDRRQNRIDFIYDKHGRLIEVIRNDGVRLALGYKDNRLQTVDLLEGATTQRLVSCHYDTHGYLNECEPFQHNHLWHEYDAQGRMTRWHDTDQTDFHLTYDEKGRVISTYSPVVTGMTASVMMIMPVSPPIWTVKAGKVIIITTQTGW